MDETLHAAVVLFNADEYRPAQTACHLIHEQEDLSSDDQIICVGLTELATAIDDAKNHRWVSAVTAADTAAAKLASGDGSHPSFNSDQLRGYISTLSNDPVVIERRRVPSLRIDEKQPTVATLRFDAIGYAASAVATHLEDVDTDIIADAIQYGHEEIGTHSQTKANSRGFIGTLSVFVRDPDHRRLIYRRLHSRVERRRQREQDINGLFD
ncbi:MAG: hypothetical protein J07HQW1_00355 [Haloquadratum walsbyi J07HQW1]|uniref:Uncharacterized protein n=1 Tax=Haloquadratum walsbyi J07HQW1 TaxID=1238424 RepID=U1PE16_9EURY|nr:MAG: hypothetical protein J07HQW1_00355 [Haloquadratum walsbyi J07HQW1]